MSVPSVQERYAPQNHCFGCGPANPDGLRIRSFEEGDSLRAEWLPEPQHEAFDGAVNGGILSTLLDCHSNWAGRPSPDEEEPGGRRCPARSRPS